MPNPLQQGENNMSENWNGYNLNGCIFETEPVLAPTLSAPQIELPQQIDLRNFCSPVENQKHTNSCVANAVVGALEFHQKKAGLPLTDISRLFVYYNARSLSDNEDKDCGSQIHHGMAAILAYGACEARLWPFQEAMLTSKPTQACFKNATRYEAVQYARTPRGVPALTALAQGLPVVFGIFTPQDYYAVAAQTGVMPRPDQVVPTRPPSGHAMLIVGYDLSDKTYLVRNSWGTGFADNGYFRIPFETMDAWSPKEAFWTIGAIEQAAGFSLSGPSMTESMQAFGADVSNAFSGLPANSDAPQQGNHLDQLRGELRTSLSSELEAAKKGFRDRLRGK
jgi:C1A family cysteine protease